MKYYFDSQISEHIHRDNIGQLICQDAIIAREGEQEYVSDELFQDGNSDVISVKRPWEEVKKSASSFEGKPLLLRHPDGEVEITPENIKEYQVGHVQNIRESVEDGVHVLLADLIITDPAVISMVEDNKIRDLSCGYFCDVDEKARIQKNILGEHVALVENGRAEIARIRDSKDTVTHVKDYKEPEYHVLKRLQEVAKNDLRILQRYGIAEALKYGDRLLEELPEGFIVDKSRTKLPALAEQMKMDPYDIVLAMEGLCMLDLAEEISDHEYLIHGLGKKTEDAVPTEDAPAAQADLFTVPAELRSLLAWDLYPASEIRENMVISDPASAVAYRVTKVTPGKTFTGIEFLTPRGETKSWTRATPVDVLVDAETSEPVDWHELKEPETTQDAGPESEEFEIFAKNLRPGFVLIDHQTDVTLKVLSIKPLGDGLIRVEVDEPNNYIEFNDFETVLVRKGS